MQLPKWHHKHAMSVDQDDLLNQIVVAIDVQSRRQRKKNIF
jgi:hypothetical protein